MTINRVFTNYVKEYKRGISSLSRLTQGGCIYVSTYECTYIVIF